MKRVLQVLGSLQRGGAETMVMNAYRQIDRTQIQFDFLVKERVEAGYEQEIEALGGKIICVPSPKKIGIFQYIKLVKDAISENGIYCAVHSHMNVISGLVLVSAYCAGVKNRIAHSHSTRFPNPGLINIFGKFLIRAFSTRKAACSEQAGEALFGSSPFVVIPNGIDTEKYLVNSEKERTMIKNDLQFDAAHLHISHIGRFADVKNHKFILEVAEKLQKENCRCVIHLLGDGELFEGTRQTAKELQMDNVVFHGSVSNVADYLKASDIFILPSKYEGVPLSAVEAQCAGLICYLSMNISNECDLGIDLVEYLPLDSGLWARRIVENSTTKSRMERTAAVIEAIRDTDFDIHSSSKMLTKLY